MPCVRSQDELSSTATTTRATVDLARRQRHPPVCYHLEHDQSLQMGYVAAEEVTVTQAQRALGSSSGSSSVLTTPLL